MADQLCLCCAFVGTTTTEILVYIVLRNVEHLEMALVGAVTFQDLVAYLTLVPHSLVNGQHMVSEVPDSCKDLGTVVTLESTVTLVLHPDVVV